MTELLFLNSRGWTKHFIRVKWATNIFEVTKTKVAGTAEGTNDLPSKFVDFFVYSDYLEWIAIFTFGPTSIIISWFHFGLRNNYTSNQGYL